MKKILIIIKQKWAEYLLEVVIITISILAAFALDSWNQERKDRKLEKYYINRLLVDLDKDLIEINTSINFSSRKIIIGDFILEQFWGSYIRDTNNWENDHLGFIGFVQESNIDFNIEKTTYGKEIGLLSRFRDIDIHDYTYQELMSNGKFDVIGHPQLRDMISNYYGMTNDLKSIQDWATDARKNYMNTISDLKIPVANSLPYEKVSQLIDSETYKISLQNLIFAHVHVMSLYHKVVRKQIQLLVSELNNYNESMIMK